MMATLDAKRRLAVPAAPAPAAPGDDFEARFDPEEDTLVFRRISNKSDWLAVLRECPFSMDDLPLRRHGFPAHRAL
jgi:hypothetical protein